MKTFNYSTALNKLGLNHKEMLNPLFNPQTVPKWVFSIDFVTWLLPYLKIIGDSREQDHWIEKACKYYNIAFEWAKKDKKSQAENLKEGDYTFKVVFNNKEYDYTGKVAYERKGSVSEFYGNCTGDRERLNREFDRFVEKEYDKVVLLLEFGEKLTDLIDLKFEFRDKTGKLQKKHTGNTIYSTVVSWSQPNSRNCSVLQSEKHSKLFWLFLQDCYYYFRNEIKKECLEKGLMEGKNA